MKTTDDNFFIEISQERLKCSLINAIKNYESVLFEFLVTYGRKDHTSNAADQRVKVIVGREGDGEVV